MTSFHVPPSWRLPERDATPEGVYLNRRQIIRGLGLGSIALSVPKLAFAEANAGVHLKPAVGKRFADKFPAKRNASYTIGDDREITDEGIAGSHNNFYEFTTAKERVWELAKDYPVDPWKVEVNGLVKKPRTLDLDDFFTRFPLEERVYRFRCVERWAMQVPWIGFPLKSLIDYLEPTASAKFVRFVTVLDKKGMPGQKSQGWYPWPYTEALRLDEARHDLALVTVGAYGHALPMQHGAPWRLMLPWKYGYKSAKSIVGIEFTKKQPGTFWNDLQPREYGFYSNVEPEKPHPRWSQRWEEDIGSGKTRETLPYNGYADAVGSLYTGKEI
ncbi:MAG: protein-methionine-sulfoxide reductase catalytic subunit MsrP [Acidobacteriota bacterium]